MTWATFYLICFVVGLALALLSLVGGFSRLHLPAKWHLPHGGLHHPGGAAHFPSPATGVHGAGPHGVHAPVTHHGLVSTRASQASPFNFPTLMAFLTWFGGTGYLLTRYSTLWAVLALGIATASGVGAAAMVFGFLVKVLLAHEKELDPADYELVGVLGTVNSSIRERGTGEIIFSQAGTRRTCGARSEDETAIAKGAEVVITRYEKGIAYVRRWEDLTKT